MSRSLPIVALLLQLAWPCRNAFAIASAAAPVPPTVAVIVPFAGIAGVRTLDRRPEIAEILRTARRHPDWQVLLTAYVATDDVRPGHEDASGASARLVIEVGGYLASRGIDANRITGRGMGIHPALGCAVVVSFRIAGPPSPFDLPASRLFDSPELRGFSVSVDELE